MLENGALQLRAVERQPIVARVPLSVLRLEHVLKTYYREIDNEAIGEFVVEFYRNL